MWQTATQRYASMTWSSSTTYNITAACSRSTVPNSSLGLSTVWKFSLATSSTEAQMPSYPLTTRDGFTAGPECISGVRMDWKLRWWVWTTMASFRYTTRSRGWSQWSLMETPSTCWGTWWSSSSIRTKQQRKDSSSLSTHWTNNGVIYSDRKLCIFIEMYQGFVIDEWRSKYFTSLKWDCHIPSYSMLTWHIFEPAEV